MAIVITLIMVSIKFQPFRFSEYNKQNIISEAVLMSRLYFGIFYITGHDKPHMLNRDWIHGIFAVMVSVPSCIFYFIWVKKFIIQFLIIVYEKNQSWFKIITFNLIDQSKFKDKYVTGPAENLEQTDENIKIDMMEYNQENKSFK